MTIYVPDGLKARMEASSQDVSWSAIAARSFEVELGRIATEKEKKTMTDAIARLRAGKLKVASELQQAGQEAGRQWAHDDAEFDELNRLKERFASSIHETRMWEGSPPAYGWGQEVLTAIDEDAFSGRSEQEEFWERIADTPYPEADFVKGFIEGALAFFEEIKDQL